MKGAKKTCAKGHVFYKSSDCPTCPECERLKKPASGFLSIISAPSRRALEREGIKTLKQLSAYTESELLSLHGFGPKTITLLKPEMKKAGLHFRKSTGK